MELKKKVTEVRFKGFSGEWDEKIIGALCKETFGGGTPSTSDPECWNGEIPWIQSSDLVEEKLSNILPRKWISGKGLSTSATKLVPENSIAIVTRVGVGKVAFIPFKYATSQDFLSLSKLTIDSWFAVFSIWNKLQSELYAVQGTSIKGITKEELLFKKINVPGDFPEQSRIGTWFQHLDQLITLHQKKYNKLTNIKKAMLEKMFPKNGADVPEIRFEGFEEKWEERSLGEVADLLTGYPFESKGFSNDGVFLVRGINVKRGYIDMSKDVSEYWPSSYGLEGYLLKENDILIQMDGALIGKSYAKIESENLPAMLVQRVTRIRRREVNCGFIYPYLQRDFLFYIKANKTETAVPHLSLNDIRGFQITVPSDEEQQKIGTYFQKLDHLITLQQTQLEKLKNIKKACSEKMFV